jgi:exo-1,4-beta-D-glucosaminidase
MWQLYDWYLNPNGAFYGAKTACQPLSVIYNYANKALYWTNRTAQDELVQIECKVYDNSSNLIFEKSELINFKSFDVQKWIDLSVSPKSNLHFLSIQLKDQKANILFNNFYWLSKISDALDYTQSTWYFTPQTSYAQFSDLKKIEAAKLKYDINIIKDGKNEKMLVQLQNVSDKISFFNEMRVIDTETNQNILPVFWSDNYVSLLPGEKRTYSVAYKKPNARPRFVIRGMNTEFLKK